jgi:hypothetical protein
MTCLIEEIPMRYVNDVSIPLAQAAGAADLVAKTIRNWLDRGQFTPAHEDEREAGSWRKFSFFDVMRMAVMGRLVSHGFAISEAETKADEIVPQLIGRYKRVPVGALAAAMKGKTLAIARARGSETPVVMVIAGQNPASHAENKIDVTFINLEMLTRQAIDFLEDIETEDGEWTSEIK